MLCVTVSAKEDDLAIDVTRGATGGLDE